MKVGVRKATKTGPLFKAHTHSHSSALKSQTSLVDSSQGPQRAMPKRGDEEENE